MAIEKDLFIEEMKARTRKFAADVIIFVNSLVPIKASAVVTYQLVKVSTSVGTNYRAAMNEWVQYENESPSNFQSFTPLLLQSFIHFHP